jgi:pimeloyl-ACP methyl ester carboxylesterase
LLWPEPAWKTIPSWFVFPELDAVLPVAAHRFMSERADARGTVEVPGASHAVAVSRPDVVAEVILTAAKDAAQASATSASETGTYPPGGLATATPPMDAT